MGEVASFCNLYTIYKSAAHNHDNPGGGGYLLGNLLRMCCPLAPSTANREKSTHHRCKICVKPTIMGKNCKQIDIRRNLSTSSSFPFFIGTKINKFHSIFIILGVLDLVDKKTSQSFSTIKFLFLEETFLDSDKKSEVERMIKH